MANVASKAGDDSRTTLERLSGESVPAPTRRAKKAAQRRSFGQVLTTPSGRFRARYSGPDLRTHSAGRTFSTKKLAEQWLNAEELLIARDQWTPPADRRKTAELDALTLGEYSKQWIEGRQVNGRPLKARTREHYEDIRERWFAPLLDRPLSSITAGEVDAWYRGLPDRPTMRKHAYDLLGSIYRTAVARELVSKSPCRVEGASARAAAADMELLTAAEVAALADAMPPKHRLLVLLAAWGGLRFGELCGLRRSDVDLAAGTVTVRRAVVTVGGQRLVTTPKSAAGLRRVYLPPFVVEELTWHLRRFAAPGQEGLLFPAPDGRLLTPSAAYGHTSRKDKRGKVTKAATPGFYAAREAIGRPDYRFHQLRHFAATTMAVAGATTAELMRFAGHSDVSVAMRYQHVAQDRLRHLANRVGELAETT